MKNINSSNIKNWDFKSHIDYLILKWNSNQALESLWQPETSLQAKEQLYYIINKNIKYNNVIPLDENILYKILFEAISENRSIENQINIFLRQISPKIALAKVHAWFIVWEIANNAYIPLTSLNDDENYVNDSTLFDIA